MSDEKKMLVRKRAGLSLSGIGGVLYLIGGIILATEGYFYFGIGLPLSYLVTGITSIIGTILGFNQVKLGGLLILIAIPAAILITFITSFFSIFYTFINLIIPLWPIPYFPYVVFLIVGGTLCRISSD
ncbi:MAG: hypothetical protein ACFE9S_17730 [Candidatus Hermodarchaeota archaeon]